MKQIRASQGKSSSSGSAYETPPSKVSAPSPAKVEKVPHHPPKPPKPPTGASAASADAQPPPETEGAKMARLRRLMEVKPSGKCKVDPELHQRWKNADKQERESMVDQFEKAGWDQDVCFFDVLYIFTLSNFQSRFIQRDCST